MFLGLSDNKIKALLIKILNIFSPVISIIFEKGLNLIMVVLNSTQEGRLFYTFHRRPSRAMDVNVDPMWEQSCDVSYENVAIVIQGPIVESRCFTIETIRLYKKFYRNIKIIVSTWSNTQISIVDELRKECHVVISEKPTTVGSHNINLQKKTTIQGLKFAKELGCSYVLKTRTDQRFYSWNTIPFLRCLVDTYKIEKNDILSHRIVELTLSVCKYRYWSMCDMFQFGFIDDLITLWDIPDDQRNRTASEYAKNKHTVKDIIIENVAEIYIHSTLAKKLNVSDFLSPSVYYKFIRDYFYLVDKEAIDLFWYKYSANEYDLVGDPLYGKRQLISMIKNSDFELLRLNDSHSLKAKIETEHLDMFEN